jgi:D-alanine-D-alanine ligase
VKLTVAVIYGGRSGEHEISLRSAESIMGALDPERYHIVRYFINKDGRWSPKAIMPEPGRNAAIDVVFPVLHGTFGEDGTVQGLLELADLPYVGPGVLASAVAMDKELAKRMMREAGIPVVDYFIAGNGAANPFGYPVFVKPANLGSSVGITKVKSADQLNEAIAIASQYDRKVIVERAIVGQEIECAVLGNTEPQASMPCEILPSREFYDYEDKYLLDKTEFRLPAGLAPDLMDKVRSTAVAAFRALQCEGMARVDFLIEGSTGKVFVNEVNTIPGFTSISMYPKMWEGSGLPYPQLLDRLIELARERHAAKKALRYER